MEDALQESLIPLKHGLLISQALPALTFFESSLRTAVKQLGVSRVTQICDTYIRDEIRSTSLNALLLHYLEKYPDDLGEICERCISCITPDTVACGALRGRMVSVDIISNVIKFDVSLGEFYDEWTGSRIWPGAIHLSRKLLYRRFPVADCNVLELGSGLGICGMAALHSGANHVAFTEHKDTLLDCCKENVDTNNPSDHLSRSSFINLSWCDFDPISHAGFQNFKASNTSKELVVIGSEVVYEESHAPIVISVLTKLFSHGFTRGLICIMTKPSRVGLDKFISLLQALPPDCPFHCSIEEEPDLCEPDQIPVFIQLYRTLV